MYLYKPFIFLSFLLPQVELPMLSVKIVDVVLFFSIILFMIHIIRFEKIYYNFEPVYLSLMIAIITLFTISIVHLSMMKLFVRFFGIIIIPCYLAYYGNIIFERYKTTFIRAFEFSLPVILILSILQTQIRFWYFNGSNLEFGLQNRAHGTFGNSAQMGTTLSMGFLVYYILQHETKRSFFFFAIMLSAVFLSGTRTAIICVMIALLLLLSRNRIGRNTLLLVIGILGAVSLYFADRITTIFSVLSSSFEFLSLFYWNLAIISVDVNGYCFPISGNDFFDKSVGLRIEKAIFALKNTFENQNYFGIGFGNCIGNSSDSLFFRLLNDGGVPLFCVITAMMVTIFYAAKTQPLRLILFDFIAVSLFFDTMYFQGMTILWGLIIAYHGNLYQAKKIRTINTG